MTDESETMDGMRVERTAIPGLVLIRHHVQSSEGGWFKENWHSGKLREAGVSEFRPVQHNVTLVAATGVTRGFHAEPWDRMVSVVNGLAFGAWVDLRPGDGFGRVVTTELDAATSALVPFGVANGYQVLRDNTVFSYLLSEHWTPEAKARSTFVNLFDPELGVAWPTGREEATVTQADSQHPMLSDVSPMVRDVFSAPADQPPRREPYRVLFVCTANICRSAYADVVSRSAGLASVEFSSAGTRALVGQPMDPPMSRLVGERGDGDAHRARQLTRHLMAQADLVITMAGDHRNYILDEWPALGRKTFVIGQVARELARIPDGVTLDGLVDHLWRHRSVGDDDDVADPYRRGDAVAAATARSIDGRLVTIVQGISRLEG